MHPYGPGDVDGQIQLGTFDGTLTVGMVTFGGSAEATLVLQPVPSIRFSMPLPDAAAERVKIVFSAAEGQLALRGVAVEVFVAGFQGDRIILIPRREPVELASGSSASTTIDFFLINFPAYLTPGDREHRLQLATPEWVVRLRPLADTDARVQALRASGGYSVTHVGSITSRVSRLRDIREIIRTLGLFFSFARGAWSEPILPLGLDSERKPVVEIWKSGRVDAWQSLQSWWDTHHPDALGALLPGFLERCGQILWRDTLNKALYWYTRANTLSGGMDGALILGQTGLELLSWVYTVREQQAISEKQFRNLRAADRFRLLFEQLGIPREIPSALHHVPAKREYDGPRALVEARNRMVHPSEKQTARGEALHDTWRLMLWYLELSILRICSFDGHYQNRLTARYEGEVERVPWADRSSGGSTGQ